MDCVRSFHRAGDAALRAVLPHVLATNPVRTRKGLAQHASSSAPVVVMKPTENGDCVNAAARLERPWNRLLVTEGLVRTRFVVKAGVESYTVYARMEFVASTVISLRGTCAYETALPARAKRRHVCRRL